MIGLFQETPKTRLRRLLGEIVPFTVGWIAGWMVGAVAGVWIGIVAGGLVWCLASAGLVMVRRHKRLVWIYRLALLLHVIFWSVQGVDVSRLRKAAPPAPPTGVGWQAVGTFRAGAATQAFELPDRTTLAGWGMRPRRRRIPAFGGFGVLGRWSLRLTGAPAPGDPPRAPLFHRPRGPGESLGARAVVLLPDAGGPPLVLVRLDLVVTDADITERVLEKTSASGVVPELLVITATHTHSAPGGISVAPLAQVVGTDHLDTTVREAVVDATVGAIDQAMRAARPARLALARSRDAGPDGVPGLARTRGADADRDPAGESRRVDTRVLGLRIEEESTERVLAVLLNYAVQPVVLRPRYRRFGRDLPGAIEDAISAGIEGAPPVLFFNGHCGDVTPQRRGHDSGPEAAAALAAPFADRVLPDLLAGEAAPRLQVRGARATQDLGSPFTYVTWGSRRAFGDRVLPSVWGSDGPSHLAGALVLPANALLWSLGLTETRVGLSFDGVVGAVVNLAPSIPRADHAVGALRLRLMDDASGESREALLLWHPAIATQALGRRFRTRIETLGMPTPFLLGLANGSMGYLSTAEEYDTGSYEALSTLYGRESAARIESLLVRSATTAASSGGP